MAWMQTDLDALDKAMATGALKVRFADGREVTYRTLNDMRSIRRDIAVSLGTIQEPPRTVFVAHSRD